MEEREFLFHAVVCPLCGGKIRKYGKIGVFPCSADNTVEFSADIQCPDCRKEFFLTNNALYEIVDENQLSEKYPLRVLKL